VNFAFGEEHDLLRSSTRRFLENRQPITRTRAVLEAPETFDREVWKDGADLGWTAMLVPAEYEGGSVTEQPLVDLVVLAEELGRVLYPGPFVPTNVVADALATAGDDAQRKELLPPIARGDVVAAWCFTEDGSADDSAVGVVAAPDDDGYRLDGVAGYVHGAAAADLLLVTARSGGGLLHALVPIPADGVTARKMGALDLTRRYGEVRLDGVTVPRSSVLGNGGPSDGAVLARALAIATILQAAEIVGAADHLFEQTLDYAKERVQFGRPIGSFQAIKHRFADLKISLEAMRAAAYYAALALADGRDDAEEAVSVAGAYVGDTFAALCGEALQLHGGIGFTWEHDVHLFVRRAKVEQVMYGDGAWHRERLCALVEQATPVGED
jgi:alkylation response protein AidB-like acyl-CoA dehydrogenase